MAIRERNGDNEDAVRCEVRDFSSAEREREGETAVAKCGDGRSE
jgi:hypothetical protein